MTLKGRKNHYNVKLLRGYGVSISLKNNKVILRNGVDVLSSKVDSEEWFVTKLPYEKIVISGRGYISTEAIKLLCDNNKNVILTDTYGHPISFINGGMTSLTGTKYRIAQYDNFRKPEVCRGLSKRTIHDKLESQIRLLKSLKREDSDKPISILQKNLDCITTENYLDSEKRCAIAFSDITPLYLMSD